MRVLLSCVGEDRPDWHAKIENLVLSIRLLAEGMSDVPVVVNLVETAQPEFVERLRPLNADVRVVDRMDRRVPGSNKLRMLELTAGEDFDVLVMLDCDMILVGDPTGHIGAVGDKVGAVPAIVNPLPDATWKQLYEAVGVPVPTTRLVMSSSGQRSYPYLNSGVLFVPRAACAPLLEHWTWTMDRVLALEAERPGLLLGQQRKDQPSFVCALARAGLDVELLPVNLNMPTRRARLAKEYEGQWGPPFIFHYHDRIHADGFLLRSANPAVTPYLEEFNRRRADALRVPYPGMRSVPSLKQRAKERWPWFHWVLNSYLSGKRLLRRTVLSVRPGSYSERLREGAHRNP